ncbi:hypothetical protein GOBAR_AA05234 [Gossypium barbadense]|uniref:Amino acid transporter transmembrane domain-containing protein n=1 Tax=Gossypium barbadense TaxID=3634 RepID=A0A2P5YIF0_GOSBA|nr:hypothetical protein GOBAR_AA05234 [Gossypium barbadense]
MVICFMGLKCKPNIGSGVSGAVFNLTTTIISAGIMALPATMKVLGLVLEIFLIISIGILSEITVEMLIRFAVSCKARSYGEVLQIAMGRTARVLSEICIIVNNAGVLIVYLIIMGDVMSGSVRHIGVFDQWIDSLSMTSAASVALAVVFVVVYFAVAFIKLIEGKIEAPRMSLDFGENGNFGFTSSYLYYD